jgi:hypothetical protein
MRRHEKRERLFPVPAKTTGRAAKTRYTVFECTLRFNRLKSFYYR